MHFLTEYPTVRAALSLNSNGNMKLRGDADDAEAITNQKVFLGTQDIAFENFHYGMVEHGTTVAPVTAQTPAVTESVDALIATELGVYVGITVADCFPVFFYAPTSGIVAVAHAGWRGIVKEIIPLTLEAMQKAGADMGDIHLEIGPGISQANFEFHYSEMIAEFGQYSQDKYIAPSSSLDKIKVDLAAIIIDQVEAIGLPSANVAHCRECTFADEKYFSARRHNGDSHSAMLAVIGRTA